MKKFLITPMLILCLYVSSGFVKAENEPKYFDTGYKVNDKTIWLLGAAPVNRENSICIEDVNSKKECFAPCYFCRPDEKGKKEKSLLPIGDKGILFQEDEFQVAYYDLETKNIISISENIEQYLSQFQIEDSGYLLDDTHWAPFEDTNFNEDKTKYALALNIYSLDTNEIKNGMICILDIKKLSNLESDYFECPIVSYWLNKIKTNEIDSNLWKRNNEYLKFVNWKDGNIEISTNENDFILDIENKKLKKKGDNMIYIIGLCIGILLIGALAILINKKI